MSALPLGSTEHHRSGTFFGANGLRWGWALALFLGTAPLLVSLFTSLLVSVRLLPMPLDPHSLPPRVAGLLEAAQFSGVLLATALLALVERCPMRSYGLGSAAGHAGQIAAGAAWGLGLLALLVGVLRATDALAFSAPQLHGTDALRWGAAWLVPFVLTGLFEEMGFRGALQTTLTRGFGTILRGDRTSQHRNAFGFWLGAVLLACVFGGVHLQNQGEAAIGAVAAALMGLVFSFSLWRTGSLWWAVGFHAAWDWAESFLFGVSDSGTVALHRFMTGTPHGRTLLSGGTVGPEGSLWVFPIIALAGLIVWFTLPSQPGSPSNPVDKLTA